MIGSLLKKEDQDWILDIRYWVLRIAGVIGSMQKRRIGGLGIGYWVLDIRY